jgi:hypothetical protein
VLRPVGQEVAADFFLGKRSVPAIAAAEPPFVLSTMPEGLPRQKLLLFLLVLL